MSDLGPVVRQAAQRLRSELLHIEAQLHQLSDDAAFASVKQALDECLARLASLGVWGPANQLPSSELWNIAGDLLSRGWLPNRARTKPRGYAGDYEMLARMYEDRCCDDPLGRHFDRYFQEEAAPRAVRGRMQLMREWIVEEASFNREFHVAVVGSAFGLEVRDALRQLDPTSRMRLKITLLDLDPGSVEFARQQLEPLLAADRLTTVSGNLLRLPQRPTLAEHLEGVQLLLCPGIFDYLDEAASAAMLDAFWQRLAPGGRLVVFQFAPHNSSRAFMEWIGNWYLIYRDEATFRRTVAGSSIAPERCQFGAEPWGVDLFVSASRP